MKRILLAALSIALTACHADDTALVDAHLRQTFPTASALHYEQRLSRPARVASAALARFLSQTHFYRATLRTGYFEYPEVQMLIAARRSDSVTSYTYRLSPTFGDDQPEFLASFAGATVAVSEREQVARAIAELFASITYAGRVGTLTTEAATITVELWHNERMWRHVIVRFTPSNTIESVQLSNPRSG